MHARGEAHAPPLDQLCFSAASAHPGCCVLLFFLFLPAPSLPSQLMPPGTSLMFPLGAAIHFPQTLPPFATRVEAEPCRRRRPHGLPIVLPAANHFPPRTLLSFPTSILLKLFCPTPKLRALCKTAASQTGNSLHMVSGGGQNSVQAGENWCLGGTSQASIQRCWKTGWVRDDAAPVWLPVERPCPAGGATWPGPARPPRAVLACQMPGSTGWPHTQSQQTCCLTLPAGGCRAALPST